jgi:DNA-binding NtrC family response regulator
MGTCTHFSRTVLVVEDEALIRLSARYALEDADCRVLEARTAEEAMQTLACGAAGIQVVFTDIRMPGTIDGAALATHTRRHWPHIAVLATSGHLRMKPRALPHGCRFIAKPYSLEELVRHIRELAPDDHR